MKVALVSFTKKGAHTCRRIEIGLTSEQHLCRAYGMKAYNEEAGLLPLAGNLAQWTQEAWANCEALVFVGACGIAVRSIAPHIKDKAVDPAVLVVDEKGKYAISLVSGHRGGANAIAREIARILGAVPVITTATDLNHKFAVDEWARQQHLWLEETQLAQAIAVSILNGEMIGVDSDYPIEGSLPEQLVYYEESLELELGLALSIFYNKNPFPRTLHIVPQTVSIGVGCKRGTALANLETLLHQMLQENGISLHALEKICSLDLKKDEAALNQLAQKLKIPFEVFSPAELAEVTGDFYSSDFVHSVTGVDNVAERAAVLGSQGRLIVPRKKLEGVTMAIAVRSRKYHWPMAENLKL
ncbi:MAG: cobalt-precorrin 5A hydrolase [Syntrophomonadaceae bacterium]|nr:cobalt-precorrin 5A hydrolase [Syntrophomonadaceae bacterium]